MRKLEKFEAQIFKTRNCWFWVGYTNNKGYGLFGKPMVLVHRLAWELKFGSIPSKMLVLHNCDTPACVNPQHLRLGNQKENMRESADKGRTGNQRGLKAAFFATLDGREMTGKEAAKRLGISYHALYGRLRGNV